MWQALDVLHLICTRLHLGHLYVGDGSRRSEEIVRNLELHLWIRLLLLLLLLLNPPENSSNYTPHDPPTRLISLSQLLWSIWWAGQPAPPITSFNHLHTYIHINNPPEHPSPPTHPHQKARPSDQTTSHSCCVSAGQPAPFTRAVNRFKNPNRFFYHFLKLQTSFLNRCFFPGSVITKRCLRSAKILAFYAMHVHIYVCVFKCISDQAAVNWLLVVKNKSRCKGLPG